MSIIHDALKKVQQSLAASKSVETPVDQPIKPQQNSAYIYATPPSEALTQANPPVAEEKTPIQNKIKSTLALICAIAITAGSLWYIYKQFQNDIPRFQRFAKKSYYRLIHKEEIPDFKTKAPKDLKPLAQLTINSTGITASNPANPHAPVTLNIHGIMSNTTGNLALINDQVYQQGDEVDGVKIVKIDLNSITVINNGTEQIIRVKN